MLPNRPKILLVDQSAANRAVYRRVLSQFDVQLLEAESGEAALELAFQGELLLVLLAVQLPGIDGFEVARRLRRFTINEDVPFLFATAQATLPSQVLQGYTLGAVDYVHDSPIDEDTLLRKVQIFYNIFRKRQELELLVAKVERENQQLYFENESFRLQQEDILRQATQDPLTQLPNRLLFEDRLRSAILRAGRARNRFALMFVDLDSFKEVNDSFGHAAGDELLVLVARRLVETQRATDTVARLGGDEFGLLFEGLDDPAYALALGRKIHQQLSTPLVLNSTFDGGLVEIRPGASIGIAIYPDHAVTREELLMFADLAMYQIKKGGGDGVRVYESRPAAGRTPTPH